uniref:Choline/carnitine acyltransferase domain-containing protein n=1 Tax=Meloidogyne javanica TaxID=6303 RepID=A0A915MJY3_MELJA
MIISQLYKKVLSSSYNFKFVPRSALRTFERMRIDPNTPKLKLNNAATAEITPNNLPKLPVPQLEHTIEKFLKFCKPILGPEDYGETLKIANKFLESIEAKQLQKKLEKRAQKLDNWLTPWWLDIAYLSARTPLPVVTSPGITFPYSVSGR